MPTTLQDKKTKTDSYSFRARLDDGASTTVHIAKYHKDHFSLRLVNFKEPTRLLDWCRQNGVSQAMSGGFLNREAGKVLGDLWIDGEKQDSVSFENPWHSLRGSLHINEDGEIEIDHRNKIGNEVNHLLQAGPLLIKSGEVAVGKHDKEGFSRGSSQFDTDITKGRYPRAAIGVCEDFIWNVVCDGYSVENAGMTFVELAQFMRGLGIKHALNLDGGGSSTLINGGVLKNAPRDDSGDLKAGRPIYSAIVFD